MHFIDILYIYKSHALQFLIKARRFFPVVFVAILAWRNNKSMNNGIYIRLKSPHLNIFNTPIWHIILYFWSLSGKIIFTEQVICVVWTPCIVCSLNIVPRVFSETWIHQKFRLHYTLQLFGDIHNRTLIEPPI